MQKLEKSALFTDLGAEEAANINGACYYYYYKPSYNPCYSYNPCQGISSGSGSGSGYNYGYGGGSSVTQTTNVNVLIKD